MTENTEKISLGHSRLTLDRFAALNDGILAVVITVLVLGIDVPQDHSFSQQGLMAFLGRIRHDVLTYAITFWFIAAYWLQHHALLHYLRYCNRALIWLNVLFLLPLTLVPFLVQLMSVYKNEPKVILLFGSSFVLCGLALLGMWRYAISKPELLVRPAIEPPVVRSMTLRILIGPIVALAGITVSFASVHLGTVIFLSMPLFYISHRIVDAYWERGRNASTRREPAEAEKQPE